MSAPRSSRPEVRNPLTGLPAARALVALPADARAALRALLKELQADARVRAETSWRKHKAAAAVYWKALAVYANHAARLIPTTTKDAPRPAASAEVVEALGAALHALETPGDFTREELDHLRADCAAVFMRARAARSPEAALEV